MTSQEALSSLQLTPGTTNLPSGTRKIVDTLRSSCFLNSTGTLPPISGRLRDAQFVFADGCRIQTYRPEVIVQVPLFPE